MEIYGNVKVASFKGNAGCNYCGRKIQGGLFVNSIRGFNGRVCGKDIIGGIPLGFVGLKKRFIVIEDRRHAESAI